ncbi:glycosyltransferase [Flavobacterium sp.]|uniref:glycosyltransferase n=1 Tax=Flavobacterium sp. TaxID=239 RepID=UPI0038FC89B0
MYTSSIPIPLISISCTTYNHELYIRTCLDGFLKQKTIFPIEVIINDDCSTDGTKEIIEEYTLKYPNIFFPNFQIENQYSKGVRAMMARFNFSRCRGKYIALCEGDDFWTDPLKLQKQVDFLENNPDFSICFHNMKIANESNPSTLEFANTKHQKSISSIMDLAQKGNFMYTASVIFRKPKDKFPDWFNHLQILDYPLHLFNAQFGKIKYMDQVMGVYRVHESGTWGVISKEKQYDRWIPMLAKLEDKFSDEVNRALRIQKMYSILDVYMISYKKKDSKKANEAMALMMEVNPFFMAGKIIEIQNRLEKTLNSDAYKIGKMLIKIVTAPLQIFKIKK